MAQRTSMRAMLLALAAICATVPPRAHADEFGDDDDGPRWPVGMRIAIGGDLGGVALIEFDGPGDDDLSVNEGWHIQVTWAVSERLALGAGVVASLGRGGKGGSALMGLTVPLRFLMTERPRVPAAWNFRPYLEADLRAGYLEVHAMPLPLIGLEGHLGIDLVGAHGNGLGVFIAVGDDTLQVVHAGVGIEFVSE